MEKCAFIPTRKTSGPCEKDGTTKRGDKFFCQTHANSIQAKKAAELNAVPEETSTRQKAPSSESPPETEKPRPARQKTEPARSPRPARAKAEPTRSKPEPKSAPERGSRSGDSSRTTGGSSGRSNGSSGRSTSGSSGRSSGSTNGSSGRSSGRSARQAPPEPKKRTIKLNKWGNYEDAETHFVFNRETVTVIGVQNHRNGQLDALSEEDIEYCERKGWSYEVPESSEEQSEEYSEERSEEYAGVRSEEYSQEYSGEEAASRSGEYSGEYSEEESEEY